MTGDQFALNRQAVIRELLTVHRVDVVAADVAEHRLTSDQGGELRQMAGGITERMA